jgi:S-adenosylmethionine:tRNA ribosyltransferase-isomerase
LAPAAATVPAEVRGSGRDDVRLLVAGDGGLVDGRFRDLPRALRAGDVVVVNTSATLPASLPADGGLRVHVSTAVAGGYHSVEVRGDDGAASRPLAAEPPRSLRVAGGGKVDLIGRYPADSASRLWLGHLHLGMPLHAYLAAHGEPIRYPYITKPWPIQAYQTIFGRVPGSAEMPSAARAFTHETVTRLTTMGVVVAPLVLHAGVSSLEAGRLINTARRVDGRAIAVGTTVVRALESVTGPDGLVHPGSGWTDVVVTPDRGVHAVDGLLTGWHTPESSHLDMLAAVAGPDLVAASYDAAHAGGYLWHEFGDLHLLMGRRRPAVLRAA